MKVIRECGIVQ